MVMVLICLDGVQPVGCMSSPFFTFSNGVLPRPRPIGLFPYLGSLTNRYPGVIVIVRNLCHILRGQSAEVEPTDQFLLVQS